MAKKIRLCILTSSYPLSPNDEGSVFVKRMVDSFVKTKMEGFVFVPRAGGEQTEETQGSFIISRNRYTLLPGMLAGKEGIMRRVKTNPLAMLQVPGILLSLAYNAYKRRASYDLIQANWIPIGVSAYILSKLTGKEFVITVRGRDIAFVENAAIRPLIKFIAGKASYLVSVNQSFVPTLVDKLGLDESRVKFIPNGVEFIEPESSSIAALRDKLEVSETDKILLHIGTLIPRKRTETLIDLLSLPAMRNYRLLICGRISDEKYLRNLKEKALSLGIQDRIIFQGPVKPDEVPHYLALAHIYISASKLEGRSNSVLEALAFGLPTFLSNIPGHAELISDGENGYLFEPNDLETLAKNILTLEDNDALREEVRAAAQKSISHLSWANTGKLYRKLFESMLS